MSRQRLQELVHETRVLRRAYVRRALRKAEAARGDLLAEATWLLAAWKHGWPDPAPARLASAWERVVREGAGGPGGWRPVAENEFARIVNTLPEAKSLRRQFAAYPDDDRLRLRTPRPDAPASRQGDLLVLKRHDPATGEPGVLYVTYNHGIEWLPRLYDLAKLAGKYVIVLEPSTWGYMDPAFLPYLGSDLDVIVQAQNEHDFAFIEGLRSNLHPVRLGAGDWVNPALFQPTPRADRAYDVVAVGAWDRLKRHDVIFRAVARLRREGRRVRLLLVGYDMGWTKAHVEKLARRHGLVEDVDWLDRVPYGEVARAVADSRVGVLMSRREGANRGIYECWMADTPTVVYRHHRGVNLEQITPQNGLLAEDDALAPALARVLDHPEGFPARAWAEAHTGCHVATKKLEGAIADLVRQRGQPWTRGLVTHAYAGYLSDGDREAMGEEYTALAAAFRPV
ncbi:MAG: glycosyltransferase [Planctomycetota bacterium]